MLNSFIALIVDGLTLLTFSLSSFLTHFSLGPIHSCTSPLSHIPFPLPSPLLSPFSPLLRPHYSFLSFTSCASLSSLPPPPSLTTTPSGTKDFGTALAVGGSADVTLVATQVEAEGRTDPSSLLVLDKTYRVTITARGGTVLVVML